MIKNDVICHFPFERLIIYLPYGDGNGQCWRSRVSRPFIRCWISVSALSDLSVSVSDHQGLEHLAVTSQDQVKGIKRSMSAFDSFGPGLFGLFEFESWLILIIFFSRIFNFQLLVSISVSTSEFSTATLVAASLLYNRTLPIINCFKKKTAVTYLSMLFYLYQSGSSKSYHEDCLWKISSTMLQLQQSFGRLSSLVSISMSILEFRHCIRLRSCWCHC